MRSIIKLFLFIQTTLFCQWALSDPYQPKLGDTYTLIYGEGDLYYETTVAIAQCELTKTLNQGQTGEVTCHGFSKIDGSYQCTEKSYSVRLERLKANSYRYNPYLVPDSGTEIEGRIGLYPNYRPADHKSYVNDITQFGVPYTSYTGGYKNPNMFNLQGKSFFDLLSQRPQPSTNDFMLRLGSLYLRHANSKCWFSSTYFDTAPASLDEIQSFRKAVEALGFNAFMDTAKIAPTSSILPAFLYKEGQELFYKNRKENLVLVKAGPAIIRDIVPGYVVNIDPKTPFLFDFREIEYINLNGFPQEWTGYSISDPTPFRLSPKRLYAFQFDSDDKSFYVREKDSKKPKLLEKDDLFWKCPKFPDTGLALNPSDCFDYEGDNYIYADGDRAYTADDEIVMLDSDPYTPSRAGDTIRDGQVLLKSNGAETIYAFDDFFVSIDWLKFYLPQSTDVLAVYSFLKKTSVSRDSSDKLIMAWTEENHWPYVIFQCEDLKRMSTEIEKICKNSDPKAIHAINLNL